MNKIIIKKITIFIITIILISCNSKSPTNESKIDILDGSYDLKVFSKESFDLIGFKFSKEYNVEKLPDAVSAYYGFWGEGSFERLSYELRFYPSHKAAKTSGSFFAEEVTGENAILKKADATWKEGIKDRSGSEFFGSLVPKYLDYVIFGNVIVLCPSEKSSAVRDVWNPIENCRKMLSKITNLE
jgi:hypothetical protein